MPDNVRGEFSGTAAAFQDQLAQQPNLVAAALVVIHLVLGMLYESLVHPLTVLSTLPAAGVGAVLALLLAKMEFTVIALIGVFLLLGIVKKNAILIIDFALEAQRARGLSAEAAVREASILRFRPILMTTLAAALLAGCAVGPDYVRPAAPLPAAWKAPPGWSPARPADREVRADWWTSFGDATLDALVARADAANQTLAGAAANYARARAAVRETRAPALPTVGLAASANYQGQGGSNRTITDPVTGQIVTVGGSRRTTRLQLGIGASWEPDLFGRISRSVEASRAEAAAASANLGSARLAIHGELVTNYLAPRGTDAEIAIVRRTVAGYERALRIAENRYRAGVAIRTDVFDADAQLASTLTILEGLQRTRAALENAIAVLVGAPASDFRLAAAVDLPSAAVPPIPATLPSTLLERRPDIAAAERRVAAANAAIGIERSAFFPSLALSADGGQNAGSLDALFGTAANIWSLGANLAQAVFDGGARRARVAQVRASYDAAVADYRQTVLLAFQQVEDQLTAIEVLARQQALLERASAAADRSEATPLNRYQSGQIAYTDVVIAQATALDARRALLQTATDRRIAAVAVVQALGGGWSG